MERELQDPVTSNPYKFFRNATAPLFPNASSDVFKTHCAKKAAPNGPFSFEAVSVCLNIMRISRICRVMFVNGYDIEQQAYLKTIASSKTCENIGFSSKPTTAFAAADIERSSLILCGNAFSDVNIIKDALSALAAPIILARGGLPLSARILVSGDSVILLFAPEDIIKPSSDLHGALLSMDVGAVLSPHGVTHLFQTKDQTVPNLLKRPAAIIFASSDR
ncbi:uncharacterized protein LOC110035913 [Phalaenopsis equestris]|uniref:uncharacterized protein LOC110035913 n=1 Tax=Phalaenopsis equestris TaxID=78828 RepID=UPI0009E4B86E|nr:uncharacterized protein LOC110035913 [Phalaenopsis equestris]